MEIPLIHWIQWTNKIPMDIFRSIGSIGSNGHFRLAISMAYYLHDVHMLVITSFKDMLIDQLKKQTSDGNSTCPLDPMDTRNSNGQLAIHLTNGMSNGLLIFPLDILHRYWALIIFYAQTYHRSIQCRRKLLLIGGLEMRAEGSRKFLNLEYLKCPFLDLGKVLTEF